MKFAFRLNSRLFHRIELEFRRWLAFDLIAPIFFTYRLVKTEVGAW